MNVSFKLGSLAACTTLVAALAACSSSSSSTGTGGAGGSTSSSTTSSSTTTGTGGMGTGGAAPASPSWVTHLDPTKGELPEGLFIVGNKAYVGLAGLGQIITIDLTTGKSTPFGSIPTPPMNGGFMLGIVVDATGNVFVGFGGGPGMVVKNGVYKLPPTGGNVTAPWATDAEMNFPNGLTFDDKGNLFVADSGGAIFKIDSSGAVTKWLADATLGSTGPMCMYAAPFPLGANGIVLKNNTFYVSNTNLAQLVSIPVDASGNPGTPKILAGPDCNTIGGVDGIALDSAGTLYGVINSQSKLIRLAAGSTTVESVFTGMPLDNPASISIATVGGKQTAFITNSSFFDTMTPMPGLLSYPLP